MLNTRTIVLAAVAGLVSASAAQQATLHFDAAETAVVPGSYIHWTVSVSFTGYPDPTAYVGGFLGEFCACETLLGDAMHLMPRMADNVGLPAVDGASVLELNMFNSAVLATNNPTNPLPIYEFDVMTSDVHGELAYSAVGVISIFPDDGLLTQPDEYDAAVSFVSDTVTIGVEGCNLADMAEPIDQLSGQDIRAFVNFFLAGSLFVDFDEDGVLGLGDINMFVGAFMHGCE